jgi:hypothetical protein
VYNANAQASKPGGNMKTLARYMIVLTLVVSAVGLGGAPSAAQQTQIPPAEYAALVALYESTDGANWTNAWTLPTTDPCGLRGVHCSNGRITRLDLPSNNLSGPIPPELGGITNLEHLLLSNNKLSGTIPPELGNLANLVVMVLRENHLTGMIPAELGNLANLGWLELSSNSLSGTIPPELGDLANLN